MVVSLKTDLRFPIPGQQGYGDRIIQPFGYLIPRMKKENLWERRTECLGRKLCSSYKGKEYAYGKGGYSHQSLYEEK